MKCPIRCLNQQQDRLLVMLDTNLRNLDRLLETCPQILSLSLCSAFYGNPPQIADQPTLIQICSLSLTQGFPKDKSEEHKLLHVISKLVYNFLMWNVLQLGRTEELLNKVGVKLSSTDQSVSAYFKKNFNLISQQINVSIGNINLNQLKKDCFSASRGPPSVSHKSVEFKRKPKKYQPIYSTILMTRLQSRRKTKCRTQLLLNYEL